MDKLVIFSIALLLAVEALGMEFKEVGSGPQCSEMKCKKGEKCELVQVTCIRAPCYPQPTCLPDNPESTCRNVRCAGPCIMKPIKCSAPPCPLMPMCPDPSRN